MISEDVSHDCDFVVPAGIERICSVCSEPESPELRRDVGLSDWQTDADADRSSVVGNIRRFAEVGPIAVELNAAAEVGIPKSRAERRRIRRAERKYAKRRWAGKPLLVH